jgi:hypothetical protein
MAIPALHSTPLESPVNDNVNAQLRSGEEREGMFEVRKDWSRNRNENRNRNWSYDRGESSDVAEHDTVEQEDR